MVSDRICRFDGCIAPSKTKGLCNGHYLQQWKGKELTPLGSTLGEKGKSAMERFEEKVDRSGECHRWTGFCDEAGYGSFWFEGKMQAAHRVALILIEGVDIPSYMTVDHVWDRGCRHKDCVNVEHLDIVTYQENNLRSNNVSGVNARKTCCDKGHEFNEINTKIRPDGGRVCKICAQENGREYRKKKKLEPGATCSFGECNNWAKAKGLCAGHWRQQRLGKSLTPLRKMRKGPNN